MKIYFAGSITGGRNDRDLYLEIIQLLEAYGTVLTEHVGHHDLGAMGEVRPGMTDADVYDRDVAWLTEADVVVAEITTPSLGVGYELGTATGKKPILCLYRKLEGKKVSPMILGDERIQAREYAVLADVAPMLAEFFETIQK